VASIAISVTPKPASQSASVSSWPIVVPKLRVCCSRRRRLLPLPGTRTVATTLSRCTSSPAQRSTTTSIVCLLSRRQDAPDRRGLQLRL
jgi:hypothetical protein